MNRRTVKNPKDLIASAWNRYEIPGSGVAADFPMKPVSEVERHRDKVSTTTLYVEEHGAEGAFRLDLAVSAGRPRESQTSDALAEQLRTALSKDTAFELLSVEAKPYGELAGAVQRMRLRETGEVLKQWIVLEPTRTIFAGITVFDESLNELGNRFLGSLSIRPAVESSPEDDDTGSD